MTDTNKSSEENIKLEITVENLKRKANKDEIDEIENGFESDLKKRKIIEDQFSKEDLTEVNSEKSDEEGDEEDEEEEYDFGDENNWHTEESDDSMPREYYEEQLSKLGMLPWVKDYEDDY
jgi:hypothetical protein